jgi:protein gp37
MNRTKIEWCDWTWNPIVGCSPASSGCANCYAEAIARRFGMPWDRPAFMKDRLGEPQRVKKPGRVFVCSMSDIGHEKVCPLWRAEIRRAMAAAPWHTYILLTKRPENLVGEDWSLCWVGVTAEDQAAADRRVPELLKIRAQVRFVSVEPMLGRVSFRWQPYAHQATGETYRQYLERNKIIHHLESLRKLDWIIAGPETGPKARASSRDWFDELAADCLNAGVPFFDKRKVGWVRREWPGNNRVLLIAAKARRTQTRGVLPPDSENQSEGK